MKRYYFVIALVVSFSLLLGCGSKPMQTTSAKNQPDWYKKVPTGNDYLYAAFSAVSQDMQLAVDKAAAGAREEIGRQVEAKILSMQKRFDEEVGLGKDAKLLQMYTDATKIVVNTTLNGTHVKDKSLLKDDEYWRAYVLVEYPIGEMNANFVRSVKQNTELYTRMRAAEAFQELEKSVETPTGK
ncbi:MAG: LPP20 family lipoprotein [bacterium]|nr:LPP20 family lipoprotein [bacterium]